jgi:2-phospho-L-lactate guanylyltransferase
VAIVPVRGLEEAKSRLGEVLDAEERRDLVLDLLTRVVRAAARSARVAEVVVVTPDPEAAAVARRLGARPVLQPTNGLNAGLELGRDEALRLGADAILVLPADLPGVTPVAVDQVIAAAGGGPVVALVSDLAGEGTNALLLAPADVIPFSFGPGSRAAHGASAIAAGARLVDIPGPLASDLDTAEDLLRLESDVQPQDAPR